MTESSQNFTSHKVVERKRFFSLSDSINYERQRQGVLPKNDKLGFDRYKDSLFSNQES